MTLHVISWWSGERRAVAAFAFAVNRSWIFDSHKNQAARRGGRPGG